MTARVKDHITQCLRQLHLPAFAANYEQVATVAATEGWTYDNYLLQLCRLELDEREQRKIQRLLNASKLPREKTLNTFDRARLKKPVDKHFSA